MKKMILAAMKSEEKTFCYQCGVSKTEYDLQGICSNSKQHMYVHKNRESAGRKNCKYPLHKYHDAKILEIICDGYEYEMAIPKNWVPLTRYVINMEYIFDAELRPIDEVNEYIYCLIAGDSYAS